MGIYGDHLLHFLIAKLFHIAGGANLVLHEQFANKASVTVIRVIRVSLEIRFGDFQFRLLCFL